MQLKFLGLSIVLGLFQAEIFAQTPRFANALRIGGNRAESLNQIEYGGDGSRYIQFGSQSSQITYGNAIITANPPVGGRQSTGLLCKIGKNNEIIWSLKTTNNLFFGYFAMDAQENIYVTIKFNANTTFLGQTLTYNGVGFLESRLAKISKNGNLIWIKRDRPEIVLSGKGSSQYIYAYRSMNFGKDTVDGIVLHDTTCSILKIDTSGRLIAKADLGSAGDNNRNPLLITKDRIYLAGITIIGAILDTANWRLPTPKPNQTHAYVAAFDTNLHFLWAKLSDCKDFGRADPWAKAADADGGILLGGRYQATDSIRFGDLAVENNPVSLPADVSANCFLFNFDKDGKVLWGKTFGSNREDLIYDLAVDSLGHVIVSGGSGGSFSIDGIGEPLMDSGGWMVKLDNQTKRARWVKNLRGDYRAFNKVGVDLKGNIFNFGIYVSYPRFNDTPPLVLDTITITISPLAPGLTQQMDLFLARLGNCNLANPVLSGPSNLSFCQGDSIALSCSAFQKYQWSNGDSTQSITVKQAGSYHCYIYDSLGCYARSQTVVVTEIPIQTSNLSASICPGQTFLGYSSAGIYIDTLVSSLGCDSIRTLTLSIKPVSTFSQNIRLCKNQTLQVGNRTYTQPGIYLDTLVAANGCDSLVTSTLNFDIPNDTVMLEAGVGLVAAPDQESYQWLDCGAGFAPIVGQTDSVFNPTRGGSYAVRVSKGNCADTSVCVLVTGFEAKLNAKTRIYPQPTKDKLFIDLPESNKATEVMLMDGLGKIVLKEKGRNIQSISVSKLPAGLYQLKVFQGNQVEIFGVMVER